MRSEQNGHEDDVNDLCVDPNCTDYGQHYGDCPGDCRGCLPRARRYGYLCATSTLKLGRNAVEAARSYGELEQDLVLTGGGGGGGFSTNPFPGISFNNRTSETRREIYAVLSSWCKLIAEEAGIELPVQSWPLRWRWSCPALPAGVHGPVNRLPALLPTFIPEKGIEHLGRFIHDNAEWLAAHPAAGEACDEIAGLVGDGLRRQDRVTSGHVDLKQACPEGDGNLHGIIKREGAMPTEVICDGDGKHRWQGERAIAELGRTLGAWDEWLSAQDISRRYDIPLKTVQRWALAHGWERTEDGQRFLYRQADVEATVNTMSEAAA